MKVLRILHNGFSGCPDPLRIGIALALAQIHGHITDDLLRSPESERGRISDIQFQDFKSFRDHAVRFLNDGSADIIENIVKLGRFGKFSHTLPLHKSKFIWRCCS